MSARASPPSPTSRASRSHPRAATRQSTTASRLIELVGEVETATAAKHLSALGDPGAWHFELKLDGYRVLAAKVGDEVRLASRNGSDWTTRFDAVARAIARLPARACLLDGEICAVDAAGVPSFQRLQRWGLDGGRGARLSYAVFDLLWLEDRDLRALPIEQRRAALEALIAPSSRAARAPLSLPSTLEAAARAGDDDPYVAARSLLRAACSAGLEGLIAKRRGSPYRAGRTHEWLKLKCVRRQEFAVLGYVPMAGTQHHVGALLLGLADRDGALRYAGKVGTGFDDRARRELAARLDGAPSSRPGGLASARGAPRLASARWSRPALVAEVAFTEWTDDGAPRHPRFVSLRDDKSPAECVREPTLTDRG
jgi:bifunctional non-homologous end joining protein LigD